MAAATDVAETPSSTPILDRVIPVPKEPERSLVASVGGYIFAFLFLAFFAIPAGLILDAAIFPSGRFFASYLQHSFGDQTTPTVFLLFLLCQYPAAVIHEAGHFLAGRCANMKLNYMRVGPLEVSSPFQLNFQGKRRRFLGLVSMTPVGTASLRWRQLALACGGPLASFAAFGVVVSVQEVSETFLPVLSMFALTALFQGLLSMVPTSSGGISWDGRMIVMLLFQEGKRNRYLGVVRVLVSHWEDRPIEEGDNQLLTQILSENVHSWETFVAATHGYSVSLRDNHDSDAGRFLEMCLAHLDLSDEREEWFAHAVHFQALKRKRLDLAREWLEELPVKTQIPGLRLQAEAAILQAQDDIQGALQKLEESASLASKMPENTKKRQVLQALKEWKTEIKASAVPHSA
jgi:hypothetical protein